MLHLGSSALAPSVNESNSIVITDKSSDENDSDSDSNGNAEKQEMIIPLGE